MRMARSGERRSGGGNDTLVDASKFQEKLAQRGEGAKVYDFETARSLRVGSKIANAANAGVQQEDLDDGGFVTVGYEDFDPRVVAKKAAVDEVAEMFPDDEPMKKKILGRWAEMREKRKQEREKKEREFAQNWDNYIGKALKGKEKEAGSMLTEEERGAEKRAELVKRVSEKLRQTEGGSKGIGRVKWALTKAMVASTIGMTLFLSACGVAEEPGIRAATKQETMEKPEDNGDEGGDEDDENEASADELERPAGVSPNANEEGEAPDAEEVRAQQVQEILEKSKACDLSEFTPEELELVGEMPELKAKFEASPNARVLENNLQVCYDGYFSQNKTAGKNSFGESYAYIYDLEDGRDEAAMDAMMEVSFSQSFELAAMTSGFESVLRAAGVSEETIAIDDVLERAQAVHDEMFSREDGGALQARLRGALKLALLSDQTSFNFYTEDRVENSFYLRRTNENAEESPETSLKLMGSTIQRHGAKQVQIVLTFDDHQETMDYNLDCGFQPNWNEHWAPKQAIVEVEVPVVTTTPEEWTTDYEEPVTVDPNVPVEVPDDPGPVFTPEDPEEPEEEPEETPDDTEEDENKEDEEPEEPDEEEDKKEEEEPDDEEDKDEEDEEKDDEEDDEDDEEEKDDDEEDDDDGDDEEEDKDDDKPKPEPEPEDEVKEKNPEGQKEVVEEGGQTNDVGKTENVDGLKDQGILPPTNTEGNGEGTGDEGTGEGNNEELTGNLTGTYEVTEEPVITLEDGVQSDEEQVEDENASNEENVESSQEQEEADQNAETDNMTPEEILGKYESILDKYFK